MKRRYYMLENVKWYDFKVKDGQIIVEEPGHRWDLVNAYFAERRLNRSTYTNAEISRLIEAVVFSVKDEADQEVIESMLEEK
jgi:hypothetical protein